MTREELHALPTYANWTLGRPVQLPDRDGLYDCAGCGNTTKHANAEGLCSRCTASRRAVGDVVELPR